jgi:hypothetical protein
MFSIFSRRTPQDQEPPAAAAPVAHERSYAPEVNSEITVTDVFGGLKFEPGLMHPVASGQDIDYLLTDTSQAKRRTFGDRVLTTTGMTYVSGEFRCRAVPLGWPVWECGEDLLFTVARFAAAGFGSQCCRRQMIPWTMKVYWGALGVVR